MWRSGQKRDCAVIPYISHHTYIHNWWLIDNHQSYIQTNIFLNYYYYFLFFISKNKLYVLGGTETHWHGPDPPQYPGLSGLMGHRAGDKMFTWMQEPCGLKYRDKAMISLANLPSGWWSPYCRFQWARVVLLCRACWGCSRALPPWHVTRVKQHVRDTAR